MQPSSFHFRGYPEFVEAAAQRVGRPDLVGAASRAEALSALSVLCSQAVETGGSKAEAILKQAVEFCDQLRITSEAAESMLLTVASACGVEHGFTPGQSSIDHAENKRPHRRSQPQSTSNRNNK